MDLLLAEAKDLQDHLEEIEKNDTDFQPGCL
jgi:hypothetical protein